ncbi:hypothetical protein J6590_097127 [Homalodisca vitripennis]|nr:hypothetical protein J6590_097127 [Homalodisca vitripennis]
MLGTASARREVDKVILGTASARREGDRLMLGMASPRRKMWAGVGGEGVTVNYSEFNHGRMDCLSYINHRFRPVIAGSDELIKRSNLPSESILQLTNRGNRVKNQLSKV